MIGVGAVGVGSHGRLHVGADECHYVFLWYSKRTHWNPSDDSRARSAGKRSLEESEQHTARRRRRMNIRRFEV